MFGNMGPFMEGEEDLDSYIQRFENFLKVNKIKTEDKAKDNFHLDNSQLWIIQVRVVQVKVFQELIFETSEHISCDHFLLISFHEFHFKRSTTFTSSVGLYIFYMRRETA